MSMVNFGVVTVVPDGAGLGSVLVLDTNRLTYFDPATFAVPWYVPLVGDKVALAPGWPFLVALRVVGRGAATYVYTGGAA